MRASLLFRGALSYVRALTRKRCQPPTTRTTGRPRRRRSPAGRWRSAGRRRSPRPRTRCGWRAWRSACTRLRRRARRGCAWRARGWWCGTARSSAGTRARTPSWTRRRRPPLLLAWRAARRARSSRRSGARTAPRTARGTRRPTTAPAVPVDDEAPAVPVERGAPNKKHSASSRFPAAEGGLRAP